MVAAAGPPAAAHAVFGPRLPLAERYAEMLATDGVVRGLIGPREAARIWDRHLINCAVVAELIEAGLSVCDVGSGAGLPGIPLAVARPDLHVDLVEPMERRAAFLQEVVVELGLERVTVTRSRAEEATRGSYDVVTARAVAPLDRLVPIALPLARVGGTLLAMKGSSATAELAAAAPAIAAAGGGGSSVLTVGGGAAGSPTVVVRVRRDREIDQRRVPGSRPRADGRGLGGNRRGGHG
jgi:16S rRNA (guanine527-N7)-methyltransferase